MGTQLTPEQLAKRAMASTKAPRKGFGQVKYVDIALVAYDEQMRSFQPCADDDPKAQIEVKIGIESFKRDGGVYMAERKELDSSFGVNNWRDIVLVSLKKLRVNVLDLQDKWVGFEFRQRQEWDKVARSVVESRFDTFYFTNIYASEKDCYDAFSETTGFPKDGDTYDGLVPEDEEDASGQSSNGSVDDAVSRAAQTLWTISGKNKAKFLKEVEKNPLMVGAKGRWTTAQEVYDFVAGSTENSENVPF